MTARLVAAVLGALLLGPAVAAAQTFEGTVSAKIHTGETARDVQYHLRGGVMRMEMQTQGHEGMVMIVDPGAKTSYMLMPSRRMYMAMPVPAAPTEARPPAEIVRTGRKETIAAHTCEHWIIKDTSGDLDACVASDLGAFTLGSMGRESGWSGALREQRGFPLKVARAGGATILEVTKIEPKRLDAALFAPPADYQKMEMPAGRPTPRSRP